MFTSSITSSSSSLTAVIFFRTELLEVVVFFPRAVVIGRACSEWKLSCSFSNICNLTMCSRCCRSTRINGRRSSSCIIRFTFFNITFRSRWRTNFIFRKTNDKTNKKIQQFTTGFSSMPFFLRERKRNEMMLDLGKSLQLISKLIFVVYKHHFHVYLNEM